MKKNVQGSHLIVSLLASTLPLVADTLYFDDGISQEVTLLPEIELTYPFGSLKIATQRIEQIAFLPNAAVVHTKEGLTYIGKLTASPLLDNPDCPLDRIEKIVPEGSGGVAKGLGVGHFVAVTFRGGYKACLEVDGPESLAFRIPGESGVIAYSQEDVVEHEMISFRPAEIQVIQEAGVLPTKMVAFEPRQKFKGDVPVIAEVDFNSAPDRHLFEGNLPVIAEVSFDEVKEPLFLDSFDALVEAEFEAPDIALIEKEKEAPYLEDEFPELSDADFGEELSAPLFADIPSIFEADFEQDQVAIADVQEQMLLPKKAEPPPPPPKVEAKPAVVPAGVKMVRVRGEDIQSFLISSHMVTNREYRKFVDAVHYHNPSHWMGGEIPEGMADEPVVNVSFRDAYLYSIWIGRRLASNAELEAAKAQGALEDVDLNLREWTQTRGDGKGSVLKKRLFSHTDPASVESMGKDDSDRKLGFRLAAD